MLSYSHSPFLRGWCLPHLAEALHQFAGVNAHRTGSRTEPVGGAGIKGGVRKVAVEGGVKSLSSHPVAKRRRQGGGTNASVRILNLQASHFAADKNALLWRRGDVV